MIELNINEIIKAVNGEAFNIQIDLITPKGVSIDTREDQLGKIFIPFKGANVDGHDFLSLAYEKGAILAFSEKKLQTDKPYILIESCFCAIKAFAKYYRSLFNIPIIGITGSAGKTTTKDIVASVLAQKFKTLKTMGNFNNEIGVPLTIFNLDKTYQVAVLEMGMNNFFEMHNLSDIVRPSFCIITNIGWAHVENLGSREGILKAKSEIFDYKDETTKIILNGDDDLLIKLKGELLANYYYLDNKDENYTAYNIVYNGIENTKATFKIDNNIFDVNILLPGKHMVYNALVAAIVGSMLDLDIDQITTGIESFKPSKNRMDIINVNNYVIINDVYNSSPDAIKSIVDTLSHAKGKKICILGDMLELGDFCKVLHEEIGQYVVMSNIDQLICIGTRAKNIYNAAVTHNKTLSDIQYFETKEQFINEWKNTLSAGDTILVKASRSMGFEDIVDRISIIP